MRKAPCAGTTSGAQCLRCGQRAVAWRRWRRTTLMPITNSTPPDRPAKRPLICWGLLSGHLTSGARRVMLGRRRTSALVAILLWTACGRVAPNDRESSVGVCAADAATPVQCYSNSLLVVCGSLSGSHGICLNNKLECDGIDDTPCANVCASGEYGQECLDVQSPYPAGCRAAPDGIFSAEATYMCCQCPD